MPRTAPIVAALWLAGCEPPLARQTLPELAAVRAPAAIAVRELRMPAGESLIWSVSLHGLTIGRAELVAGADEIRSRFRTGGLASSVASVRHDLITAVDRAAARAATERETLVVDGETTEVSATFDGTGYAVGGRAHPVPGGVHTLHTALGVVRAWADRDAGPGYLFVVHAGKLFRLELAQPTAAELAGVRALRVDGRIRPVDRGDAVAIALWLSADPARLPLRIEIRAEAAQLTAELVPSS
jgi:hypothetical protein